MIARHGAPYKPWEIATILTLVAVLVAIVSYFHYIGVGNVE